MTPDLFNHLVDAAILAPSVHNTQPARWRFDGQTVTLLEDTATRLTHADAAGHDAELSLGAALEGFALAASLHGFTVSHRPAPPTDHPLRPVAHLDFHPGGTPDPLTAFAKTRQSWRAGFLPPTDADRAAVAALDTSGCYPITNAAQIRDLARLGDTAGFSFLKDGGFRRELLTWMRLRPSHPRWNHDGMNGDAMQLGPVERIGAGFVMGAGFAALNAVGLARPLLSDAAKFKNAAGVVLFARPENEPALTSGRAFYRAWLSMTAAGLSAQVVAALADDPDAARQAGALAGISAGQRLISAFRVGRAPATSDYPRARLSRDDVIV